MAGRAEEGLGVGSSSGSDHGDADTPVVARAVLFDPDGTPIDCGPRSRALWRRLLTGHGIECGEGLLAGFSGRRSTEVIEEHLAHFGRHTAADRVRRELTALNDEPGLPPVRLEPGVVVVTEREVQAGGESGERSRWAGL